MDRLWAPLGLLKDSSKAKRSRRDKAYPNVGKIDEIHVGNTCNQPAIQFQKGADIPNYHKGKKEKKRAADL